MDIYNGSSPVGTPSDHVGDDVGIGEAHVPPVGISGISILLINTVDLNLAIPSSAIIAGSAHSSFDIISVGSVDMAVAVVIYNCFLSDVTDGMVLDQPCCAILVKAPVLNVYTQSP